MNLDLHNFPTQIREYDAQADVWYVRAPIEASKVNDTDLDYLCDDFAQGFTRYYSLKVLSEARQAGAQVTLVFKVAFDGQNPPPCAITPYHKEHSMLEAWLAAHGSPDSKIQRMILVTLGYMYRPNP